MKKSNYRIRKTIGGLLLGTVLFMNFNGQVRANDLVQKEYRMARELPKPQYQNHLGAFSVDFTSLNVSLDEFVSELHSYFGADENNTFEMQREYKDESGNVYYNYQHLYNNLKVEGDVVFIQVKNNKIQYVSGQFVNIANLNTTASVSDDQAKRSAYEDFGTNENVTEGAVSTVLIKAETEDRVEVKLVKKIALSSALPLKSNEIYVDAQNGNVLMSLRKVYHADTPSTSTTLYRGNQSMTVDSYNGSYRLMDNLRNIHTRNGSGINGVNTSTGEFTGATEYTSTTANFTGSATQPAVEVHWGMSKTYDYYKTVHNRNSYDGNGSVIRNYYNPPTFISPVDNAGAIDGQGIVGMVYGKGQILKPVVALDVAGHEFSHLVISRNGSGGLNYLNESGALNESFADMFGTAIEFYVNLSPNWTIGEGLMNTSLISPNYMRNMADPNSAPSALGEQPDTYKGTYWKATLGAGQSGNQNNDWGGVHTNSGVGNYWFYLLSEGGYGTNDINNQFWVEGIGIQKAEKIAYKALLTGLTSTATYMDAYNATKQAAATLYGANSEEWNQVVNAWYAVGIGNAPAAVKNMEMQSKLNVYPNPAAGVEVFIDSDLEGKVTVEMFDLSGKQVMASKAVEGKTSLNVANLVTGMYILKFKSALGEYSHKLMVK